ncbi:MAG: RluA family pseudouridine synthase [Acidimicrobiia bacterium]
MTHRFTVPASLAGERVDRAVALLTGWSRREVRALVDGGTVIVDGEPASARARLSEGSSVALLEEPPVPTVPGPGPVPVVVRHADADVIVIAKPAGLVVHPGAGHADGTLVNGLLARFPELGAVGDPTRPGIVHRLDRDTSGLLLVARSRAGYDGLVRALSRHEVDRRYAALVWGHPEATRGEIDAPIGRSPSRRTRMAVRTGGRDARTAYEVEATYGRPEVALLGCRLETGRTHQIRVHLAAIGHPVVGDAAYGGARPRLVLDRPFLHAARLAFEHPVTGVQLEFEEPLPPDLAAVRAGLGGTR